MRDGVKWDEPQGCLNTASGSEQGTKAVRQMPRKQFRAIPEISIEVAERFWAKVDIRSENECWPWKTTLDYDGYGFFHVPIPTPEKYLKLQAHRIAFYLEYGVDLGPLLACHRCDNPPCCNPEHFFVGTKADNQRDAALKGRIPSGSEWARVHAGEIKPVLCGEINANAILTTEQVLEIRSRRSEPRKHLGAEFGISWRYVQKIIDRKRWRHI